MIRITLEYLEAISYLLLALLYPVMTNSYTQGLRMEQSLNVSERMLVRR